MLRLASNADVHGAIIRGIRRKEPAVDVMRVQDLLPSDTADPDVLDWAAASGRILITNDRRTMIAFARERISAGKKMPGLLVTSETQAIGSTIQDLIPVATCMTDDEIEAQVVVYLPLRS